MADVEALAEVTAAALEVLTAANDQLQAFVELQELDQTEAGQLVV